MLLLFIICSCFKVVGSVSSWRWKDEEKGGKHNIRNIKNPALWHQIEMFDLLISISSLVFRYSLSLLLFLSRAWHLFQRIVFFFFTFPFLSTSCFHSFDLFSPLSRLKWIQFILAHFLAKKMLSTWHHYNNNHQFCLGVFNKMYNCSGVITKSSFSLLAQTFSRFNNRFCCSCCYKKAFLKWLIQCFVHIEVFHHDSDSPDLASSP